MIKSLLLSFLLLTCLSQIIPLEDAIAYADSNKVFIDQGFWDVPTNSSDDPYPFVKDILEYTYPDLENWTLVDIKEKLDEDNNQTVYLYTYFEIGEDENGTKIVLNLGIYIVINH